ncbi:hypothetical protein QH639_04925 [Lysinibacillus sp. 1 U-2021]|uniref:hypothetical protein n=1 Tax=Lysinibacillus sp. 1 U-2021 TaxID=3039426 RepID=UPI00248178BE|nr:hypothetical protein [Lysinibacillus sp. 1 U-2021]WGT40128.1 hypothetical protein QH639_04925 [Lysinibacillus sp. 1 U-2021]
MKLNNMQELEQYANARLANDQPIELFIDMPGFDEPELITNPPANIENKLAYYKATYDENLEHKHAKGIRIVGTV